MFGGAVLSSSLPKPVTGAAPCPVNRTRSDTPPCGSSFSTSPYGSFSSERITGSSPARRLHNERSSRERRRSGNGGSAVPAPDPIQGFVVKGAKPGASHSGVRLDSQYGAEARCGLLGQCFKNEDSQPGRVWEEEAALRDKLAVAVTNSHKTLTSEQWACALRDPAQGALHEHTVQQAYAIAACVHSRRQMERLEHIAITVAKLGMDAPTVAAALLHTCMGVKFMSRGLLAEHMPENVVALVADAHKASRVSSMYKDNAMLHDEITTERLRAMLIALGDVRVMLIMLAERLQAARELGDMSETEKREWVLTAECLFIPIANRLGVWSIQSELEDLCFKAMKPALYDELRGEADSLLAKSRATISEFMHDAMALMKQCGVAVEDIEGRPKSLSSLRKKLAKKSGATTLALENVHDVLAVRIIAPTKTDCYRAMRELTARWPAISGRYKNYIKEPKANGYQSLHNVVVSDSGLPIELQIRTPQMHWNAEYGVAAHWRYKEQGKAAACKGSGAGADSSSKVWSGTRAALAASEDALKTAQDQQVAWSRMMLAYGHGVHEYAKARPSASMRRSCTLAEVMHALMDGQRRQGGAERESARGGSARAVGRGPLRARSVPRMSEAGVSRACVGTSFLDFVASTMLAGRDRKDVYVVLSTPSRTRVEVMDGCGEGASVASLLSTAGVYASPGMVSVNGMPSWGGGQRLATGDVVSVHSEYGLPSRLPGLPEPTAGLHRELYGLMARFNGLQRKAEDDIAVLV